MAVAATGATLASTEGASVDMEAAEGGGATDGAGVDADAVAVAVAVAVTADAAGAAAACGEDTCEDKTAGAFSLVTSEGAAGSAARLVAVSAAAAVGAGRRSRACVSSRRAASRVRQYPAA
jgi:hypothetical protein